MIASLRLRRVMLSLRRRIRCDHNQRNRGFLVVAATRVTRLHIRITAAPGAHPVRPCAALRFTLRSPDARSTARAAAARGQS